MKILAVDDDAIVRDMMAAMCTRLGYPDIVTAWSGEAALTLLMDESLTFDCLLLDISMVGMNGIELCRHARSMPRYATCPIIMLTSMRTRDYVERAFEAGATDYTTKPFKVSDLGARLTTAAEHIAARHSEVTRARQTHDAGRDMPPRTLAQEVSLPGFPDIIRYHSLGNYLMQMSAVGLSCSQVFVVKIDDIETIFERATEDEFQYALSEVADAIRSALRTQGHMMAYKGDGQFMIVMGKGSISLASELEDEIHSFIDMKESEYDDGTPMRLEVSIGNPIQPHLTGGETAWLTFDRAISRALTRYDLKPRRDMAAPQTVALAQ
ncbi:response regulator [Albirhodobacter sp. R86504]|jgi:CheY-like chemotaxis protein|uniref:response regulator n=1 Tax=Albirhodobacter sp. R86504 TaxID=3093848 RepID=UPI00366ECE39